MSLRIVIGGDIAIQTGAAYPTADIQQIAVSTARALSLGAITSSLHLSTDRMHSALDLKRLKAKHHDDLKSVNLAVEVQEKISDITHQMERLEEIRGTLADLSQFCDDTDVGSFNIGLERLRSVCSAPKVVSLFRDSRDSLGNISPEDFFPKDISTLPTADRAYAISNAIQMVEYAQNRHDRLLTHNNNLLASMVVSRENRLASKCPSLESIQALANSLPRGLHE